MLQGKTALITGASRGIGRAIALLFAQHGCNIAFTYQQSDSEAQLLLDTLQQQGTPAICIKNDASNYEAAHLAVQQVIDTFGKIDILICNAGITRDTLLMRMHEQQWDEVINTNLKSVFNYCHAVTPHMVQQRRGTIIAMSSVVAMEGNPGQANYAASKAGIISFIKTLARELGARNIRANAIAPGFIDTDMTQVLPQSTRDSLLHTIPLRRCGQVEEVAQVALFLASDMASYITGEVIQVDGGI